MTGTAVPSLWPEPAPLVAVGWRSEELFLVSGRPSREATKRSEAVAGHDPEGSPPAAADRAAKTPVARPSRTTWIGLGSLAVLAILLAVLAASNQPVTQTDAQGNVSIVHYGWLSVLPALITILLAFTTRQVILSLLVGIASGGILFGFGSGVALSDFGSFPWRRLNFLDSFILTNLGTRGFAVILFVYLWSLGGLIGLWGRTGGALHFAHTVGERLVVGPRSAKFFTWVIGLVFHQGGTISTVLAGTTARPLLDEHGVSKEEASYMVDSTASPVATVLPFNAFPIVAGIAVAGTIPFFTNADGSGDLAGATAFFFRALWFNFYSWFAVLLTLLFALHVFKPFGAMRRARERAAQTGELVRPGSAPLMSKELDALETYPGYRTGMADFALPLIFLLGIAIGPYVIKQIVGNPPVVYVAEAFFSAVVVAAIVAVVKGMPVREVIDAILEGAKGVTVGAIIIGLAVSLSGVARALGTGAYVASLFGDLPPGILPLMLLVAAMFTAFSTGTSFGTFGVLLPVAMPLADALVSGDATYLALCFAAVVSGATYGDQCSPISDTTILSSLATGCDLMDHVTTQMPLATVAAGLAGVLFVVLGFVLF